MLGVFGSLPPCTCRFDEGYPAGLVFTRCWDFLSSCPVKRDASRHLVGYCAAQIRSSLAEAFSPNTLTFWSMRPHGIIGWIVGGQTLQCNLLVRRPFKTCHWLSQA